MTTAHRPTFDPARGKSSQQAGTILHNRMLPAHTKLKYRQQGQGGDGDGVRSNEEMKRRLLEAEMDHSASRKNDTGAVTTVGKRKAIEDTEREHDIGNGVEDVNGDGALDAKKPKFTVHESDQSSDESEIENSEESESEDEDEQEALMRELQKIREERAEEKRILEEEEQKANQAKREQEIAYGNPLLNDDAFEVKRSWTDETVFKGQAKSDKQRPNEFINDMLRSDFHRQFINRYIR